MSSLNHRNTGHLFGHTYLLEILRVDSVGPRDRLYSFWFRPDATLRWQRCKRRYQKHVFWGKLCESVGHRTPIEFSEDSRALATGETDNTSSSGLPEEFKLNVNFSSHSPLKGVVGKAVFPPAWFRTFLNHPVPLTRDRKERRGGRGRSDPAIRRSGNGQRRSRWDGRWAMRSVAHRVRKAALTKALSFAKYETRSYANRPSPISAP